MARKRVVKVDGNKIAKARAETKLDQESFARKAGVSVRTLQRAEKSDMISPNKIAQIAGELRVNSEELIQKESPATTNSDRNDGYGNLSLKPVRSHKDIQKLCLSHSPECLNLDYQISPQPELVEKVAAVIKDIQASIEFEASGRGEGIEWGDPFDYAAQFKKDMEFTQILRDLWDGGIFLFAGHYTYRVLRWTEIPTGEYENRWLSESKRVAVLRFFDEKSMAQSTEISERVFFGLSKSTVEDVQLFSMDRADIRVDGSTETIVADNQIGLLDIPF